MAKHANKRPGTRDRQTHWRLQGELVERLAVDAQQAGVSVAYLVNRIISGHYAERDATDD